jgi:hypothetical protein
MMAAQGWPSGREACDNSSLSATGPAVIDRHPGPHCPRLKAAVASTRLRSPAAASWMRAADLVNRPDVPTGWCCCSAVSWTVWRADGHHSRQRWVHRRSLPSWSPTRGGARPAGVGSPGSALAPQCGDLVDHAALGQYLAAALEWCWRPGTPGVTVADRLWQAPRSCRNTISAALTAAGAVLGFGAEDPFARLACLGSAAQGGCQRGG